MTPKIPKKTLEKLISKFYEDTMKSEEYCNMVGVYTLKYENTGVSDPIELENIFNYLDKECQLRLKTYLDKKEKRYVKINNNTDSK
jgi:hypothetical protein